jgi:hypothetical protein
MGWGLDGTGWDWIRLDGMGIGWDGDWMGWGLDGTGWDGDWMGLDGTGWDGDWMGLDRTG